MSSFPRNDRPASCCETDSLLARSVLYREFLAEREEILRFKWFESEKAGRDIGLNEAKVSWVVHHRANWRAAGRQSVSGATVAAPAV